MSTTQSAAFTREELLRFFTDLSDAFWKDRRNDGSTICPKHHLDHTGKTCAAIVLNQFLSAQTGDDTYRKREDAYAAYVLSRVAPDDPNTMQSWSLLPGFEKGNMSNPTIDSGAGIDALATYVLAHIDTMDASKLSEYKTAIERVSGTRLKGVVTSKPVNNQRLWAGTGLAGGARLLLNDEWKVTCLKSIDRAFTEVESDGFFPYTFDAKGKGEPLGAGGTSPYYHSRHLAFMFHMLGEISGPVDVYRERLLKSLDALAAMVSPLGTKPMALECKRWYWHSDKEGGSNAFDIYALLKGWKMSGNTDYAIKAVALMKDLFRYQSKSGFITPVTSGEAFVCYFFSSADAVWITRVFEELLEATRIVSQHDMPGTVTFRDAALVSYESEQATLLVRTASKQCSVSWGEGMGGALPVAYHKRLGETWVSQIEFSHLDPWEGTGVTNWIFFPLHLRFTSLMKSFFRTNARELKQQIYYTQVELIGRNFFSALHIFFRHFLCAPKFFLVAPFSMGWGSAVALRQDKHTQVYETIASNREKTVELKSKVTRTYLFDDNAVRVSDHVEFNEYTLFARFILPRGQTFIQKTATPSKYLRLGRNVFFIAKKRLDELMVEYLLDKS